MSDLTKRILEIGKPLFRFLSPLVGWTNNDMKAGVFDIDIENALASMSPHDFAAVEAEVNSYRTYTVLYVKYGYKRIDAKCRKDALAMASNNRSGISWNDTPYCLKAVRSRCIHEFRITSTRTNITRVEYIYDVAQMNQADKKSFVKSLSSTEPSVLYNVEYYFIKDSFIMEQSKFSVTVTK